MKNKNSYNDAPISAAALEREEQDRANMNPATWSLYKCRAGTRFSATQRHHYEGEMCSFSGCNCNTRIKKIKVTENLEEASSWFRRPNKENCIKIKVRAQLEPKFINKDIVVETNRYIEVKKKITDLKIGDSFELDGVWYDVELLVTQLDDIKYIQLK